MHQHGTHGCFDYLFYVVVLTNYENFKSVQTRSDRLIRQRIAVDTWAQKWLILVVFRELSPDYNFILYGLSAYHVMSHIDMQHEHPKQIKRNKNTMLYLAIDVFWILTLIRFDLIRNPQRTKYNNKLTPTTCEQSNANTQHKQ